MKLEELATVKTGLVLARKQAKLPSDVMARYRQLNLKAINENGYIEADCLEEFHANEGLRAEYLTQPKDIIVRLTTPYTAVLIDDEYAGIVIPSHFVVIRTIDKRLLPEYLYWLLNSERIKSIMLQNISSTMIGTVKPSNYANLSIDLLSLNEQRQIAKLNRLAKRESFLLKQLKEQKELYYNEAINIIQKEMRKKTHENN